MCTYVYILLHIHIRSLYTVCLCVRGWMRGNSLFKIKYFMKINYILGCFTALYNLFCLFYIVRKGCTIRWNSQIPRYCSAVIMSQCRIYCVLKKVIHWQFDSRNFHFLLNSNVIWMVFLCIDFVWLELLS